LEYKNQNLLKGEKAMFTYEITISPKCFKGIAMPSSSYANLGPGVFRR
jgi:hypothetical protein